MQLKDFIGNQPLVDLLRRGALPQATLFRGPEGVGKKTLALALAALANCKKPAGTDLCGQCGSCVKAAAGYHPDILLFPPDRNLIRIEVMREMNREVQFRPFEGKLRFFLIDQAEKMNQEAANSILKTLEEPPETSRIVLMSAFPDRLLPTIRSRCQTFCLYPLKRDQVEAYLRDHSAGGNEELRAAFADGSIGKALALNLEQIIQERRWMLDLMTSWCQKKSFEAIYRKNEKAPLKNYLKNRDSLLRGLDLLTRICEDLYFLQVGTPKRVVNCDLLEELQRLVPQVTLDWVSDFLYHTAQSRWEVEHYVNPLLSFETLWLRSAHAGNSYSEIRV